MRGPEKWSTDQLRISPSPMSKKTRTIQFRAAVNRGKCAVPYCTRERHGASTHCQPHVVAARRYGHPQGRATLPREYANTRARVVKLFDAYPRHPGVQEATQFLANWMNDAAPADSTVPAAHQLRRLFQRDVTPRRALEELAAIYSYRQCGNQPDDARLTFALANALFRLAPREPRITYVGGSDKASRHYRAISRSEREAAGRHLRDALGPLLKNIADSIDSGAVEAAARAAKQSLTAPFHQPLRTHQ